MVKKKVSKGYELTSKLAGSFLRCLNTLSDIPFGKYVILGLGTFLVFVRKLYHA